MRLTILTKHLLLQTAITMNIVPVMQKNFRDQLLLIEKLQIVNLRLHTKNQSPNIIQFADNLKKVFHVSFSENIVTDEQFLGYCIYSDVRIMETINNLDGKT